MGMAEEIKSLAQEIVSSYDTRVSSVATIIETTHQMLEAFRTERAKMSDELREKLANGRTLRRKDFDAMMQGIRSRQDQGEEEVRRLTKNFVEEHKKMASELKRYLAHADSGRLEDFRAMMKEIQSRQTERGREVRLALEAFQREQDEMARELKALLAKGESLGIGDFKAALERVRTRQENIQNRSALYAENHGGCAPFSELGLVEKGGKN
jgi:DNA-binding ferritin-like protein